MFLSLTSSHNFIFSTWIPETHISFGKLLPGAISLGSEWRMPSRAHLLVLVCPRCSPPKQNDCHLVCLILYLAWGLVRAEKAGKSPEVNGDFVSWLDYVYKWQPTPVFLPGESHGWRSLVDYSPWGHKDSDTTNATQHTAHKQVSLNLEMFCRPGFPIPPPQVEDRNARMSGYEGPGFPVDSDLPMESPGLFKATLLDDYCIIYCVHCSSF